MRDISLAMVVRPVITIIILLRSSNSNITTTTSNHHHNRNRVRRPEQQQQQRRRPHPLRRHRGPQTRAIHRKRVDRVSSSRANRW
uniref:Putative secreted protein n=1 Tax=Anopheles darlingi TaxID=43151 RepID=A0A2M4DH65_ANODA